MIIEKWTKNRLGRVIFGCLFAILGMFGVLAIGPAESVYADPPTSTTTTTETTNKTTEVTTGETIQNSTVSCEDSLGSLSWLICPTTGKISEAVDWLYEKIENVLVIKPVEMKDGTPIYEIWKYARGITNIVFIILFLVVIYSQLTGVGISNYGIKKVLPKMIVVAILVNLSFIVCSILVDVSNIVGSSLRGVFTSIEESTLATMDPGTISGLTMSGMYTALAGGALIGVAAIALEPGLIFMLIPVVLGALVSVASGLITIALRQAVVALLIMISPLAVVAYMLPNTEDLFKKWKKLLTQMLVFYPMFSLLFGASSLAGWAIITSAKDGFTLILGIAVQIFPLFFSWSLMKMSGTFLSTINGKIQSLAAKPLATNRAWADSHRQLAKQKKLASNRTYLPSVRLMQFLSDRKVMREEETAEHAATVKLRGQAYAAMRNYKADGTPSKEGEEAYEMQARNARYQRTVTWHKNNMNKGLGQLEAVKAKASVAQRARLDALDNTMVKEADALFAETARGEMIERRNAEGRYNRFEAAMNVHMDDVNGYVIDANGNKIPRGNYKFHFDSIEAGNIARERYKAINDIMEGQVLDTQYASAAAAQAFDTQAKIVGSKFQKYFELLPPTKDLEYRLREFSQYAANDPNFKVVSNIDTIISGLRMINMRGDTDIVKSIMDDLLDKKYGGLELGTHASQALASFLMFEVKDNDPFLRRFGKYINLETARIYNENDRKAMNVTYDEYVKGYHDEPDGTRMYAKKDMKKLVEGTSLDNIERTALSNLDESLKKAYGFDKDDPKKTWDIDGWMRKREEIQTAFEPAFLSSSLKWLSGSEQINSGVKFWTGYELKQQKNDDGTIMVDENGDPVYDLTPSWKGKEFAGHEDEVEKYFRRKTMDYFKDQTTGQILGMRTDYREPTMEHLLTNYLEATSEKGTPDERKALSDERKRQYEEARAEIQSRYGDKPANEAQKLRAKDLKKLKMELAGVQVRKILGETGKLKQIYRTRTSGTAINAKDWLRGWVNLDNEEALREEVAFYEEERKRQREEIYGKADVKEDEDGSRPRIYHEEDKERFLSEMQALKDKVMDDETDVFFEETKSQLEDWFGGDSVIVKKYDDYYHKENVYADNIELYGFLKELLDDLGNYPDA